MTIKRFTAVSTTVVMLGAAFILAPSVTATQPASTLTLTSASTFTAKQPAPIVTFPAVDIIPIAEQEDLFTVTVARPALKAKVVVNWGDGTSPSAAQNKCNRKFTLKMGSKCVLSFAHYFDDPGVYNVTVTQGGRTLG